MNIKIIDEDKKIKFGNLPKNTVFYVNDQDEYYLKVETFTFQYGQQTFLYINTLRLSDCKLLYFDNALIVTPVESDLIIR